MKEKEPVIRWETKFAHLLYEDAFKEIEQKYPEGMDLECVSLCDALNMYPGIKTVSSCCGHGRHSYGVWFKSTNNKSLAWVIFHTSYLSRYWSISVDTEGTASEITYWLKRKFKKSEYNPDKYEAYLVAERLALNLRTSFKRFQEKGEE